MRIDQITPSKRFSDGISHVVSVLQKIIKDMGFNTGVLAEATQLEEKENVIYHMLLGSQTTKTLGEIKAQNAVLFYHGITPPQYYANRPEQHQSLAGQKELAALKNQFTYAFTTTKHLEKELHRAGYERTMVLPLPVDLKDYDQETDARLMQEYTDDHTNLLFAGQITPDKKIEDIISVFNYYHKKINSKSRLFLVGNYSAHPWYSQKLLALVKELQIKNVFLTGRVSPQKLLTYYQLSRVFLCMSEYEALFAPLTAGMYLKVPIIAFEQEAVQEVLGGAGCLIKDKDIRETARFLDTIISDQAKRESIINRQLARVSDLRPEKVIPLYREAILSAFKVGG